MAFKVFYAWQQDRPNNLCRGLIRRALDQAAKKLNDELEIEDAVREVEIDQDTQGVAGSPSVAETILVKIRECDVFIPDLTFIPTSSSLRSTPNPNVLVEYGYALHAVGDQRIVGVFNESFGSPSELPFDLQHKRWPIRYEAADEGDSNEAQALRRAARNQLADRLADQIRDIFRTFAQQEDSPPAASPATDDRATSDVRSEGIVASPMLSVLQPARGSLPGAVEQYPWDGGLVGVQETASHHNGRREVRLLDGPSITLNLRSRTAGSRLSSVRTTEIANRSLRPMAAARTQGWSYVRSRHGVSAFTSADNDPNTAFTASMLTRSSEIYGIDRYHLQVGQFRKQSDLQYIPTGAVEEILIDALANYLNVAERELELPLPIEIAAGIEGVEGFRLAVDRKFFGTEKFVGHIFGNNIGHTAIIDDYDCDPFDLLLPLFEDIYDCAGFERPDVRTMGRSQR